MQIFILKFNDVIKLKEETLCNTLERLKKKKKSHVSTNHWVGVGMDLKYQ